MDVYLGTIIIFEIPYFRSHAPTLFRFVFPASSSRPPTTHITATSFLLFIIAIIIFIFA